MSPISTSPKSHPLSHVDEYLAVGQSAGASDVHLGGNAPPIWRLHGTLQPIWPAPPRLTSDQTLALADGFLSNPQKTQFNARGDADFAYANKFAPSRSSVARRSRRSDGCDHGRCDAGLANNMARAHCRRDRPFGFGNAPPQQRYTHARSITRRLSTRARGTSPDNGEPIAPRRQHSVT